MSKDKKTSPLTLILVIGLISLFVGTAILLVWLVFFKKESKSEPAPQPTDVFAWPQNLPDELPPFTYGEIATIDEEADEVAQVKVWTIFFHKLEDNAADNYFQVLKESNYIAEVKMYDNGEGTEISASSAGSQLSFNLEISQNTKSATMIITKLINHS